MKNKVNRILSLLLCAVIVFSVTACSGTEDTPSKPDDSIVSKVDRAEDIKFSDDDSTVNQNAVVENIKKGIFPMFSNDVDYSRGGATSTNEEYADYKEYIKSRHEYADMIDHESEVSAVRLAQLGVFAKIENFMPQSSMTVGGFLKALMMVCKQDINGSTSDAKLKAFIDGTNFLEKGVQIDYSATLTNEQLAYFLSRATADTENYRQYELLISDYDSIDKNYRAGVLKMIKLGLIGVKNYTFYPKASATRAAIADGLYRLINTGARLIPPYDLGNLYTEDENEYLVKTSYKTNEAGIMFGLYTYYNRQARAFETLGKLPIDRTGFNKWVGIETSEGVYNWPTFGNDSSPHKMGQTSIICVDISANLIWNPQFQASNIPAFYSQDITNTRTRTAAKRFLYNFVQQMLSVLYGDVLLLIDYEIDWQQAIYQNTGGLKRAQIFSEWFVEACGVAREAAKAAGAADRLKLGVNYNNITNVHKRGPAANKWMLDMAEVVDYVTFDSYQFYDDKTDPSFMIQNMRYLMNNYSLGKPVMVVENGLGINQDNRDEIDKVTGLTQTELAKGYWRNLFREYRFALERGDFLNANFSAYLIWSYDTGRTQLADNATNTLHPWGEIVKRGIDLMYRQNQFNPSYISSIVEASITPPEVSVSSGTEYEKLTYVVTDYKTDNDGCELRVRLSDKGTVFVTVNGVTNVVSSGEVDTHVLDITDGVRDGLNVIDIYFGATKAPSKRTVEKILLN